ncbi:PAS domain-containing sensor histidine kinase [Polaribacter glomeratus]|uniref:PAS domain-containing sensor histidine kinase n=1 Tax=Polaribacter glomeratus TaxID=102 RepID=UPI001476422D|nr:PAS domain-containing sensor histidine kinase [Polaribacter glomeratus]
MIIICNQVLINNAISQQGNDVETINIAGKQRMYSQQITKIAFYSNKIRNTSSYIENIEALKKIMHRFKKADTYLKQKNKTTYNNESINILFEKNILYFNEIINSFNNLAENPENEVFFNRFIATVKKNEAPFLTTMDAIVNEYQKISEDRLNFLKKMEYFFITFTSFSLLGIVFFMFLPIFRKNKELTSLNSNLERFKQTIKQKEEATKRVEEILDRTNSVARIGTWEVDFINQKVLWSKVTKEIHDTDITFIPSIATGIDFYKEGYSRDKITTVIENSITNNTSWDEELQIVTTKGKTIWVRAIGKPEFKDDKCVRLYGTFQDINTVKIAQIELNKVNEELNAIFDSGTISIIRTDINGLITYFNEGAELLLGYKSKELINKETPIIFHDKEEVLERGEELSKEFKEEIKGFDVFTKLTKENRKESSKWKYIRKNGTFLYVQLSINAVKDSFGTIIAFIWVGTDITEVTEQNNQLANFAQIASHNLRAPISNLNSLLDLYDISETQEEKDFTFDKFRTVIDHLSETLHTLIEAIKIRAKTESEIEVKPLYFKEMLQKIDESLSKDISKLNGIITSDFSAIDTINYNEPYLENIISNLISNSLRYSSPERTPKIEFKTTLKEGKVQLLVTDNGLGIDLKKHAHRLFGLNQVFHRHKDSQGVGLYIIKNQIESLKGTISCISEVDKGTTFVITF